MQSTSTTAQEKRDIGKRLLRDLLLVGLLMMLGAVVRWRLADLPNFAPVASIAMFAGLWTRWRILAAFAPVGALLISDIALGLGNYEWPLMCAVYGSLSLPVIVAPWLKAMGRERRQSWRYTVRWIGATVGTAIGGAFLFFVVTNAFVWYAWYSHDWEGLVVCFANALPFLRFTLIGDLTFCGGFLVMHEVVARVLEAAPQRRSVAAE